MRRRARAQLSVQRRSSENRSSNRFGEEEDGRLTFHIENAIKGEFLERARIVSLGGRVPTPTQGQEFGL